MSGAGGQAPSAIAFISHAGEDRATAEEVCRILESDGVGCWLSSRDIGPGRDYAEQIIDAIEGSRVVVLLLSARANESVFVRNEVERAISKGRVIMPLRIQDVQPSRSLELFISNVQWIDAWTPPLEARVHLLAAAIQGLLRMPPLQGSGTGGTAAVEPPSWDMAQAKRAREVESARPGSADAALAEVLLPLDWAGEATEGLTVPIGFDAHGKPASFDLGHGSAHHALIGGMVGSGKTNLLRLLIDQFASRYPPDELGLYLLDFKERMGLADYVALPHARVIGLEAEREFALSVLHDLRGQMEARAASFRASGVAQYPEARAAGLALARLVLVMEEFQILLADDDALGREAAVMLEDIVRRGSSFGVHVLLVSQTPALAGYLRNRVYEQMGLRVALRSRETTSAAILGEGNLAAASLERSGEAITNDDFGHPAANRRVRIALLPTDEHRSRIAAIVARDAGVHRGPVTFESDTPAQLSANPRLAELREGTWRPEPGTAEAFLGEPIELTGPTSARFERYPRASLLVAGPEEAAAYGLLEAAVISLALQDAAASFYVLDFARPGSSVAGVLTELQRRLPSRISVAVPSQAGDVLRAALADLTARVDGSAPDVASRFLVVAGLHRWRELRGAETFKPTAEAAGLLRLADEGPDHGWHTIAWTDGFVALDRVLGRAAAGRFDLRAALRIPEADSMMLFDSSVASRLGDNRGLFRHEQWPLVRTERFKPYRLLGPDAVASLLATDRR